MKYPAAAFVTRYKANVQDHAVANPKEARLDDARGRTF